MIKDRTEAGKLLAQRIGQLDKDDVILAIPRGGVVVGHYIAEALGSRLDVIISKKITPVDSPEFAIGAITHDGTLYRGEYWDRFSSQTGFDEEVSNKREEAKRRVTEYRGFDSYDLKNRRVVLVDDGVATGNTIYAILEWLKKQNAKEIILAVPVIPLNTFDRMRHLVDKIVSLETPQDFSSVGQFYKRFEQVSDDTVKKILKGYVH